MKTFDDYKGTLPYASELFGIYQPLLGWKSRIIRKRYEHFRASLHEEMAARALVAARPPVRVQLSDVRSGAVGARTGTLAFKVTEFAPFDLGRTLEPHVSSTIDTGIARLVLSDIGNKPPADWRGVITQPRIEELLKKFQAIVSNPGELRKLGGVGMSGWRARTGVPPDHPQLRTDSMTTIRWVCGRLWRTTADLDDEPVHDVDPRYAWSDGLGFVGGPKERTDFHVDPAMPTKPTSGCWEGFQAAISSPAGCARPMRQEAYGWGRCGPSRRGTGTAALAGRYRTQSCRMSTRAA